MRWVPNSFLALGLTVFVRRTSFPSPPVPPSHPPPWSLPRVGNGSEKRHSVTPVHLLDDCSNFNRRVRLTRKTRPVARVSHDPDPGRPTPRRWKRLRPSSSDGEEG